MMGWIFRKKDAAAVPAERAPSATGPIRPAASPSAQAAATPAATDWAAELLKARGDDGALLALARAGAPLDIRLAAVEALAGEPALKMAERELRGQDRRLHRAAKQRLQAHVATRLAQAQAARLIDAARALADAPLPAANHAADLDRAWLALDATLLADGQAAEFAALKARLTALLQARADSEQQARRWQEQTRQALAALQAASDATAADPRDRDAFDTAAAAARAAIDAAPAGLATDALALALQRAAELESTLADRVAQQEAQLAQQAEGAAREALAVQQRQHAKARQGELREQQAQALAVALEQAEAALADGRLAEAQRHLAAIDALPRHGEAAAALQDRIGAAQAQFAQLQGWQHWSGGRARDELLLQAEALAIATRPAADGGAARLPARLSLKQHAEVIDGLRARWKELDRSGGPGNRALWQRFDAALTTAHEPVAAQRKAQAAAREDNLALRLQLVAALEAVPVPALSSSLAPVPEPGQPTGPVAFDARTLADALHRFETESRKLGPLEHTVPHQARQTLAARIDAAVRRLQEPLDNARRGARQQREHLVARAQALAAEAALPAQSRDPAAELRLLQMQWQQQARALPMARGDEQALWTAFKSATDAVFSAREAAFKVHDDGLKANAGERQALIDRLQALADATPAELRRALAEADTRWSRCGPAPRTEAAALEQQFRAARDAAQRWLDSSAERAWHAVCDALAVKLASCEEIDHSADARAAQASLAQRWPQLAALPPAWEQPLRQRAGLPATAAVASADPAAALATDEVLLQLEAACGLPTPPAFEPARRGLKLQAMKAALEGHRAGKPALLTPGQWVAAALRRHGLDAAQRDRLHAAIAGLRQRGAIAAD